MALTMIITTIIMMALPITTITTATGAILIADPSLCHSLVLALCLTILNLQVCPANLAIWDLKPLSIIPWIPLMMAMAINQTADRSRLMMAMAINQTVDCSRFPNKADPE